MLVPSLDPGFKPAVLWKRSYDKMLDAELGSRDLGIALLREDGGASVNRTRVLPENHPSKEITFRYIERLLKFLLWQRGGCKVQIAVVRLGDLLHYYLDFHPCF